jgi:hypothetical protein
MSEEMWGNAPKVDALVTGMSDSKARAWVAIAIKEMRAGESDIRNMTSCAVGHEGALAIAAALPGSRVTSLWLVGQKIGDQGAEAIAAALPGSIVDELWLGNNKITGGTLGWDSGVVGKLHQIWKEMGRDRQDLHF